MTPQQKEMEKARIREGFAELGRKLRSVAMYLVGVAVALVVGVGLPLDLVTKETLNLALAIFWGAILIGGPIYYFVVLRT